jgi:RHS repeat-associated protein
VRVARANHHQRRPAAVALVPLLLACASVPKVGGQDLASGDQAPRPETRVRGIEPAVDYPLLPPDADSPRQHQGMEALPGETGVLVLSYAQQRWYDPRTGRFLSEDPVFGDLQRPGSLHAFGYANGIRWRSSTRPARRG